MSHRCETAVVLNRAKHGKRRRSSRRTVGRRQTGGSTRGRSSRVLARGERSLPDAASSPCILTRCAPGPGMVTQQPMSRPRYRHPSTAIALSWQQRGELRKTFTKENRKPTCTDCWCCAVLQAISPCALLLQSGSRASSRGGSRPPSCPRSPQLTSPPRSPPLDGIRSPPRGRSPAVGSAQGATPEVTLETTEDVCGLP